MRVGLEPTGTKLQEIHADMRSGPIENRRDNSPTTRLSRHNHTPGSDAKITLRTSRPRLAEGAVWGLSYLPKVHPYSRESQLSLVKPRRQSPRIRNDIEAIPLLRSDVPKSKHVEIHGPSPGEDGYIQVSRVGFPRHTN